MEVAMRYITILLCLVCLALSTACFAKDPSEANASGIALGPYGSVYVLDDHSSSPTDKAVSVVKYDSSGRYIQEFTPQVTAKDPVGKFEYVATDHSGNVYIAANCAIDGDQTPANVFKCSPSVKTLERFRLSAEFIPEGGLAVDASGRIYVLGIRDFSYLVECFDQSTVHPRPQTVSLPKPLRMNDLIGIAVSSDGKLCSGMEEIPDEAPYCFDPRGKVVRRFVPAGHWSYSGCRAVDGHDNLYIGVTDDSGKTVSVQKFSPSGHHLMTFKPLKIGI
jgi:streptogramin lyase